MSAAVGRDKKSEGYLGSIFRLVVTEEYSEY